MEVQMTQTVGGKVKDLPNKYQDYGKALAFQTISISGIRLWRLNDRTQILETDPCICGNLVDDQRKDEWFNKQIQNIQVTCKKDKITTLPSAQIQNKTTHQLGAAIGSVKCAITSQYQLANFEMHIKNDLAISLLGIYPRKIIIYEHQATNPKEMLIMALFMIAENRNNPILFKEEKLISIVIECNVIQQSE